jgi:hypothetical protein
MAAKTRGKGTVLAAEINSVYTAIPQIISLDIGGEESTTYDGMTLDGTTHPARPATGFASNPDISFECFWDSGDTVHTFLKNQMRTPPVNGVNVKVSDAATSVQNTVWNVQGIGIDEKYAANDGVKATVKLATSGNPS